MIADLNNVLDNALVSILKVDFFIITTHMKRISSDEVKKVAQLARLELNASEIEQHSEQLEKILDYIKQLEKINTKNIPCTTRAIEVVNVFRQDEKKDYANSEELINLAPLRENKFFKVPKIIND